jgi:hypothetical protein
MFPTSLVPESNQRHKMAYVVGEYSTTLGGSKDKQRLVVYPALSCIIEVDDVLAPLRECLAQTHPDMLIQQQLD